MHEMPEKAKEALRSGNANTSYKIEVSATETQQALQITNNNLVSESVTINERMCSSDNLKFGLCEGSVLEFIYFGLPDITGRTVKVFIEFDYNENGTQHYSLPMGYFLVESCAKRASTGLIKATCYNKLKSDYLDKDATKEIKTLLGNASQPVFSILDQLLDDYSIHEYREATKYTTTKYDENETAIVKKTSLSDFGKITVYTDITKENSTTYYYYQFAYPCKASIWDEFYRTVLSDGISTQVWNLKDSYDDAWFHSGSAITGYVATGSGAESFRAIVTGNPLYYMNMQTYFDTGIDSTYQAINLFASKGTQYSRWQYGMNDLITVGTFYYTVFIPEKYIPNIGAAKSTFVAAGTRLKNLLFPIIEQYFECRVRTDATQIEKVKLSYSLLNGKNVTLRELQSAVFEVDAKYGKLDRNTDLFNGVNLGNNKLLPADTLFPYLDLYPYGETETAHKSIYSKLWTDDSSIRKFRYLIITYVNQSGTETKLQRTVNTDGTDDYNMSDNWLFRNLTWSENEIGQYADNLVTLIKNIRWIPFEIEGVGLPFLETGDGIEVVVNENTYPSYILQRTIKGIRNLQDVLINGTINTF